MTTSVGMMSFAIGIFLFLIVYGQLWMCMNWRSARRKRLFFYRNRGLLLQQLISSDETLVERMKIFNLAELEKATNKFDSSRIIGRGGHGSVYKGILSDQRIVAIKKSKITDQREIDQFINEVVILSQINHRNIVKLFGCCLESEVPLLVYEFISGGTLLNHLRGSRRFLSLSFDDRLRVAIDIAGALSYLHSAASISIFHRDVKSSNILLDENWTVKISDFGASRTIPFNRTSITTTVQGTYGYLDPEYYMTEKLTQKSDVYSFGVILAELLIGQDVFSYKKNYQHRGLVVDFICSLRENTLFDKLDPHMVEDGASEELEMVVKVAEMCLKPRGEERPTMKEVEQKLDAVRRLKKLKDDAMVLQNRVVGLPRRTASAVQICLSDLLRQHSLSEQFMFSLSEQSR